MRLIDIHGTNRHESRFIVTSRQEHGAAGWRGMQMKLAGADKVISLVNKRLTVGGGSVGQDSRAQKMPHMLTQSSIMSL